MSVELPFDLTLLKSEPESKMRDRHTSEQWYCARSQPVVNNNYVLDPRFSLQERSGTRIDKFTDSFHELPVHVTLIDKGVLFGAGFFVCDLQQPTHSSQRLYLSSIDKLSAQLENPTRTSSSNDLVYLVGGNSPYRNFYHWCFQCLPAILLLRKVARGKGLDYRIVVPPLNDLRRRSLLLAGVDLAECLTLESNQFLTDVTLVYTSATCGDYSFQPSTALIELLHPYRDACLDAAKSDLPTHFYVARRDASQKRPMENEDEVIRALVAHGYEELTMSELSIEDQVSVFANAESIVAPHGAGLVNLMFAPPTACLVEIMPEHYQHACFFRIAQLRGIGYTQVISTVLESREGRHTSLHSVDITRLLSALKESERSRTCRAA